MLRYTVVASVIAVLVMSTSAFAAIMESEPNDTMVNANLIPNPGSDPWGEAVVAYLSPAHDVDYFKIVLEEYDVLAVTTTLLPGFSPDTLIALYRADGTLLVWDDAIGTNPDYISWTADVDSTYYIGVTGFDDAGFAANGVPDGVHTQTGFYGLMVVVDIPEPATLALLSLGGVGLLLRRRRR